LILHANAVLSHRQRERLVGLVVAGMTITAAMSSFTSWPRNTMRSMQYVRSDVSTVCLGMGMSAGAMILCGGAAGKRFALPNAKVMIHQGSGGFRGTPADIQIAAREILDMTKRMAEIISRHSGQDVDQVLRDIDRDRFMRPQEAVEYGLIDAIMEPRGMASG
jgi:ATP-dependent Clp protease, protease subunit